MYLYGPYRSNQSGGNSQTVKIAVWSAVVGAVVGVLAVFGWQWIDNRKTDPNQLVDLYYQTENAVLVSPHSLRVKMDSGDQSFILVDLRSAVEYEKEHIVGAVNIPAYKDPNTPAYEDKERIVSQFRSLPSGKEVIVYCYSAVCMTGRKIGLMVADEGIYVKHLGIGWNEWRYAWKTWNHEGEWANTKAEEYVASGTAPGVPKIKELPSPCGKGELSC
ncbi:MAG: rhodanese-like domain-containing protein [bacterium]